MRLNSHRAMREWCDETGRKFRIADHCAPEDDRVRCVLILVQNLSVPFDRRVWQEARTLAANGYHVHVICPSGKSHPESYEVLDGVIIHRYRPGPEASRMTGYLIEYSAALAAMLYTAIKIRLRHRIDVVQACNPPDLLFLVVLMLRLLGPVKFIFDHHDLSPELLVAKGKKSSSPTVRVARLLERVVFKLADVSIATNDSYAEIARQRGRMRPANVFVVRSGVDVARIANIGVNPKYRFGHSHVVGYVGVMGVQEGINHLLEAMRIIVFECGRKDVCAVLAGDGPERKRLQRLSDELGLAHHVIFLGRIPDNELIAMLSTATVCVNPDVANDMNDLSTMNKILEYMAIGKPIVQFDLKEGRFSAQSASAYARRNDSKSLADEILAVIDNLERSRQMGMAGRRRLESLFTWDKQVPKLLAAYDQVMNSRVDSDLAAK